MSGAQGRVRLALCASPNFHSAGLSRSLAPHAHAPPPTPNPNPPPQSPIFNLLHARTPPTTQVVKAGKVRYIGVSNETSYGVSEFAWAAKTLGLPKIQTIQNVYHLLQRVSFETDLAETCR